VRGRFEYVLGVLCREPSFFPADSLEGKEGHFTRQKSAEIGKMQKTAEKCRPGRGRNRYKDTRKPPRITPGGVPFQC